MKEKVLSKDIISSSNDCDLEKFSTKKGNIAKEKNLSTISSPKMAIINLTNKNIDGKLSNHFYQHKCLVKTDMFSDSENLMNIGGEFKFIEEYKATTGGLVNFFLHEKNELILPVFAELIKRSVGLIAWQKVVETRAYYCEGLIHLTLLFRTGLLRFEEKRLRLNFNQQSYEKFKSLTLERSLILMIFLRMEMKKSSTVLLSF